MIRLMRCRGFLLPLLCCMATTVHAQRITADFTDRALTRVLSELETQYDLGFSYLDTLVAGKRVNCRFKNAGWEEVADCLFTANELDATHPSAGTIILTPAPRIEYSVDLAGVVVRDVLARGVSAGADGRHVIVRPERTAPLPGFAEEELYRRAATLPGVTLNQEAAGNLSIRGGARDQNLILYDGIPVYATGHYFDMVSLFVPSLVDEMVLHRGHADAAFGGRLSGVLELNTDERPAAATEARLEPNLLYGTALAKLPFAGGAADFQLGLRTSLADDLGGPAYQSYRDQVFQRTDEEDTRLRNFRGNVRPSETFAFDEINARLQTRLNEEATLTATGYYHRDDYRYREQGRRPRNFFTDELTAESYGLGLRYRDKRTRIQLAHAYFNNSGALAFRERRTFTTDRQESRIRETSLLGEHRFPLREASQLTMGIQLQWFDNAFDLSRDNPLQTAARADAGRQSAALIAPYLEYERPLGKAFKAGIGLRLPYYGPTEQVYFEPRLSASYGVGDWRIKAAYAHNHQYVNEINPLDADQLSSRAVLWALANDGRIRVAAGREVSLGVILNRGRWLFDAEAYYKTADDLTGFNYFLESPQRGLRALDSRGGGVDLLLARRWKGWSAQARYTLSAVEWRFGRAESPVYFPAENDRRHYGQVLVSRRLGRWELSGGWQYHTGARYTFIPSLGARPPVRRPTVEDVNRNKLPAYHRLDFTVNYSLAGSDREGWMAEIGLSLLNLYHRENLLDRGYLLRDAEDRPVGGDRRFLEEVDRVGLGFTPNVSVRVGWRGSREQISE